MSLNGIFFLLFFGLCKHLNLVYLNSFDTDIL